MNVVDVQQTLTGHKYISVLPTSVIDVGPQKSRVRAGSKHSMESSRATFSPYPEEVARLCYELYLRDCTHIIDPFAGWGERHYWAKRYGKQYTGYDISDNAIRFAKETYGVDNILADSNKLEPIPAFDGMITSPPYYNLEKYSNKSDDLSNCVTLGQFRENLLNIFKRFYDNASRGCPFCISIGDFRRDGRYYNLSYILENMFVDILKAELIDKVIVSRKKVSKIKIMIPQAVRHGYTVKVHEYLYVFSKR